MCRGCWTESQQCPQPFLPSSCQRNHHTITACKICQVIVPQIRRVTSSVLTGLRREVLVLHALRPSGAGGGSSHIDAVARWLLQSQHASHSQVGIWSGTGCLHSGYRSLLQVWFVFCGDMYIVCTRCLCWGRRRVGSFATAQTQHFFLQGAGLAPVADSRLQPSEAAVEIDLDDVAAATPPQSPARLTSRPATPGSEATPPTGGRQAGAEQPATQQPGAGETADVAATPSPPPQAARAQFPDAISAFTAAARRHADRVGVIHLAMCARDGGLVTAWHQRLESVAEPGAVSPCSCDL